MPGWLGILYTREAFNSPLGRVEAGVLTIGELAGGHAFYDYCIGNNVRIAGPGERAYCEWTLLPEEEAEARRVGLLSKPWCGSLLSGDALYYEDVPEGAPLLLEEMAPDYLMAPPLADLLQVTGGVAGNQVSEDSADVEGNVATADRRTCRWGSGAVTQAD